MSKFTRGDWLVADTEDCITIGNIESGAICRIKNTVSGRPLTEEDRANAELIAQAPKLLEETTRLRQQLDIAVEFIRSQDAIDKIMRIDGDAGKALAQIRELEK